MMILVTYDVNTQTPSGCKRLRKIAKICQNYGQRVQNSVFECLIDPGQFVVMKNKLEEIMNEEVDSLRFYSLGKKWERRVEHIGKKIDFNMSEPMIL